MWYKKKTMKTNELENFLKSNGIKKQWLAQQIGMSPELLRYHLRTYIDIPDGLVQPITTALQDLYLKIQQFSDSQT